MKREWLAMVLLTCLAVLTLGGAAQAAEKREVVVWMWTAHVTDQYQSWYERFTEWFEAENPGATIRFEFADTASGEKLTAAVAGGAPPDVSLVSIAHARTFYEAGMFRDLNKYVEQTPYLTLDNFLPTSVIFGQKDGKIFGLPWSLEAKSVLYNSDHLIEAGLDDRPESLRTWQDLVSYARHLVKREPDGRIGRSGFVSARGTIGFASYLYSNGGSFYNETGTAVSFNHSKGVDALEIMYRFAHEYDVTREGAGWMDVTNGTASMVIGDTSATPRIRVAAPDFVSWMKMAPIPQGPQGTTPSTVSWSNMFVIPRGAAHPDLAWAFIKLWLSPEVQEEFFKHFGGDSVKSPRRDFLQSDAFRESMVEIPYMVMAPEIFGNAGPYPYIRFGDINRQMGPLLTQAERDGTLAPSAALAEAERIANSILQE